MWTLEEFLFAYLVVAPIAGGSWYVLHWAVEVLLDRLSWPLHRRAVRR